MPQREGGKAANSGRDLASPSSHHLVADGAQLLDLALHLVSSLRGAGRCWQPPARLVPGKGGGGVPYVPALPPQPYFEPPTPFPSP